MPSRVPSASRRPSSPRRSRPRSPPQASAQQASRPASKPGLRSSADRYGPRAWHRACPCPVRSTSAAPSGSSADLSVPPASRPCQRRPRPCLLRFRACGIVGRRRGAAVPAAVPAAAVSVAEVSAVAASLEAAGRLPGGRLCNRGGRCAAAVEATAVTGAKPSGGQGSPPEVRGSPRRRGTSLSSEAPAGRLAVAAAPAPAVTALPAAGVALVSAAGVVSGSAAESATVVDAPAAPPGRPTLREHRSRRTHRLPKWMVPVRRRSSHRRERNLPAATGRRLTAWAVRGVTAPRRPRPQFPTRGGGDPRSGDAGTGGHSRSEHRQSAVSRRPRQRRSAPLHPVQPHRPARYRHRSHSTRARIRRQRPAPMKLALTRPAPTLRSRTRPAQARPWAHHRPSQRRDCWPRTSRGRRQRPRAATNLLRSRAADRVATERR